MSHVLIFKQMENGEHITMDGYNKLVFESGCTVEKLDEKLAGVKGQLSKRAKRSAWSGDSCNYMTGSAQMNHIADLSSFLLDVSKHLSRNTIFGYSTFSNNIPELNFLIFIRAV